MFLVQVVFIKFFSDLFFSCNRIFQHFPKVFFYLWIDFQFFFIASTLLYFIENIYEKYYTKLHMGCMFRNLVIFFFFKQNFFLIYHVFIPNIYNFYYFVLFFFKFFSDYNFQAQDFNLIKTQNLDKNEFFIHNVSLKIYYKAFYFTFIFIIEIGNFNMRQAQVQDDLFILFILNLDK